jgi:hypothetical protein
VIRLKTGQDYSGWVLRSVKGREAVLQKDQRTTTLVLPVPGAQAVPGVPPVPGQPVGPGGKEPDL